MNRSSLGLNSKCLRTSGSWSHFMRNRERGLSMNRPKDLGKDKDWDLAGQTIRESERGLSMNRDKSARFLECGGKRSATPLWGRCQQPKAVSPLRSATAVQDAT